MAMLVKSTVQPLSEYAAYPPSVTLGRLDDQKLRTQVLKQTEQSKGSKNDKKGYFDSG